MLKSAQACIAGLFAPIDDPSWNEQLNAQPIPIHTVPHNQDYLLTSGKKCDRSKYFKSQYKKSAEYKGLNDRCKKLLKQIEKHSGNLGRRESCLSKLANLRDTLFVEKLQGKRFVWCDIKMVDFNRTWENSYVLFCTFSLPNWAEEIMTDGNEFEYLVSQQFLSNTRTAELKRLYGGFLLKEIFDRSAYKALSPTSMNQTLWMYFGHDSTIAGLLNTLGVFEVFFRCIIVFLTIIIW